MPGLGIVRKSAAGVVLAAVFFSHPSARAEAPLSGETPRLFAPGVISTGDIEFCPAFERDGRTVFFTKGSPGLKRVMWIMVSRLRDGAWTTPEIAPFSGRYSDIDPTLSPDGRTLFFASTRPTEGTEARKDFDLWVVEKTDRGWGEPRHLGAPVNSTGSESTTSVTADGTLYFASGGRSGGRAGRRLFRSRLIEGRYAEPEPLPPPIDAGEEESNQYVSPDGRFMIFSSKRSGAAEPFLYISHFENGAWTEPVSVGAGLNAEFAPYTLLVSPDGKSFYFTSQKGRFDHLPADPMSYESFVQAIRKPGNGLADIYSVGIEAIPIRRAPDLRKG
jgi:Tol biopolymer transport system component